MAVCDGPYKLKKGATAWVIEGPTSVGRITGWNHVPGDEQDQSAYRNELLGILGITSMLTKIYQFQKLEHASITIACDNLSALNNALDTPIAISIRDPDHDLLFAIRQTMQAYPITRYRHHVYGHQDTKTLIGPLDR
jgi:hypothetical protein